MSFNRANKRSVLWSWILLTLSVGLITFLIYDSGWVATTREPRPYSARLELVGLVVLMAYFVNLLCRLFRGGHKLAIVRAFLSGMFVTVSVYCVGGFFADRYLMANGIGHSDYSGFYLLMYEGWGMVFPLLAISFGVLTALREVLER